MVSRDYLTQVRESISTADQQPYDNVHYLGTALLQEGLENTGTVIKVLQETLTSRLAEMQAYEDKENQPKDSGVELVVNKIISENPPQGLRFVIKPLSEGSPDTSVGDLVPNNKYFGAPDGLRVQCLGVSEFAPDTVDKPFTVGLKVDLQDLREKLEAGCILVGEDGRMLIIENVNTGQQDSVNCIVNGVEWHEGNVRKAGWQLDPANADYAIIPNAEALGTAAVVEMVRTAAERESD